MQRLHLENQKLLLEKVLSVVLSKFFDSLLRACLSIFSPDMIKFHKIKKIFKINNLNLFCFILLVPNKQHIF